MLLKGYEKCANITLLDTIYIRPKKISERKYDDGRLIVLFKDNDRNKKMIQEIKNPSYLYYIAKDDTKISHNLLNIPKDKVIERVVPFKELQKDIATVTGNLDFFWDNIRNGNRSLNQKLHFFPRIFFSDMSLDENFRWRFSNEYKNPIISVTKAFLDIETDNIHQKGDFPEPGECPINAVTIIFDDTNISHTFLLRNKSNPLIDEFEKGINKETFNELRHLIRLKMHGNKYVKKYELDKLKYNLHFYNEEDEIKLIADVFKLINYVKPDFLLVWNMSFDMPYFIERIKKLGYKPEDIIPPRNLITKKVYYYIDDRNEKAQEKKDHALISSYTIFIDQLIHFAGRRKNTATAFKNWKLDYIGEVVAGVGKLDYSYITTKIFELPYLDYKTFVFYNIIDVIVQKCIEHKSHDVDYIFNKSIINNTQYHKVHSQTVYIVNRMRKELYQQDNQILGNNVNRFNHKEVEYDGAFVASIKRLTSYPKMKINGYTVNIVDNAVDYDFKSLYPSIARENNIAHNTQIGRILIEQQIWANENRFHDEKWNRSTEFIENFQSHNWLEFAHRWLNLGNYQELYKDLYEYYTKYINSERFTPKVGIRRLTPLFVPAGRTKLFVKTDKNDRVPLFVQSNDKADFKYYCSLATKEDHTIIEIKSDKKKKKEVEEVG